MAWMLPPWLSCLPDHQRSTPGLGPGARIRSVPMRSGRPPATAGGPTAVPARPPPVAHDVQNRAGENPDARASRGARSTPPAAAAARSTPTGRRSDQPDTRDDGLAACPDCARPTIGSGPFPANVHPSHPEHHSESSVGDPKHLVGETPSRKTYRMSIRLSPNY